MEAIQDIARSEISSGRSKNIDETLEIINQAERVRLMVVRLEQPLSGWSGHQIVRLLSSIDRLRERLRAGSILGIRIDDSVFEDDTLNKVSSTKKQIGSILADLKSSVESMNTLSADLATGSFDRLRELKRIVPDQRIAPTQFEFSDDLLRVRHQQTVDPYERSNAIESSRQSLLSSGENLLKELGSSNCDRRMLETFKSLQDKLVAKVDVIQLGLINISCELMFVVAVDEMPGAVLALLTAHTRGVNMYLGQFPEWCDFAQNAAVSNLTDSDAESLHFLTRKVVSKLQFSEAVESEVPRTIEFYNSLIYNPKDTNKKAIYAVLKTLENLISSIFSFGVDFVESTLESTKKLGSRTISIAIVTALFAMAISSAESLLPTALKVSESTWLKAAAKLGKELIAEIK